MAFPTVDDCIASSGVKRELLHEFDHLLRDALVMTQHKARKLDLEDEEVDSACVTVMMTVAAGAALAASDSPREVTTARFTAIARDALTWAKNRLDVFGERKN
jgi:hypothetical protein